MTTALDPSALISNLTKLLPESKKISNQQEAIALLLHATLIALDFRLVGVDDDSKAQTYVNNALPDEWNKGGPGNHTIRYRHDQSSLEFVVKLSKLGSRTIINAIAAESDKTATLDISTNDFTSASFFPFDAATADAQPLVHGFISSNRVTDLVNQIKSQIVTKIVPGLRKDGYTEESENSSNAGASSVPRPTQPQYSEPFAGRPRHEPPYRTPQNPLEIGRRDIDPFPQNPFAPPSLFPQTGSEGMFVGPNHPIFGMRGRGGRFGDEGPWAGDGFLPAIGAPPGARFDPITPFSGGIGGMPRRRPRGGITGAPDNDEFMPPGAGDMDLYM